MIYIDPPYNTGGDFVYPDKYADNLKGYLEYTKQVDADGNRQSSNMETSGRYHSNWLNMMLPRLHLAKNLLSSSGVIFISIDDNEITNLRKICDEIFGEENFISIICWQKFHSVKSNAEHNVSQSHDFILCYAKQAEYLDFAKLPMSDKALEVYKNLDNDPRGRWRTAPLTVSLLSGARGAAYKKTGKSTGHYTITAPNGKEHTPSSGRCWIAEDSVKKLIEDNRIWWGKDGNAVPMQKIFLEEKGGTKSISTFWKHEQFGSNKKANEELKHLFDDNNDDTENFPTPKPTQLIKTMVSMMGDDGGIVLDFFAGSATTGHSVLQYNAEKNKKYQYILVQLPEAISSGKYTTIAEIGKERIRRAASKIKEEHPDYDGDLGFKVFKLDSSNIEAWDSNVENLEDSVLNAANVLKDGRSELDIVYELFLKYGLDLSYPVNTHEVAGKQIYEIGAGSLFICLEDGITTDFIEALIKLYESFDDEAAPRVVFKDSGFKTDAAKKDAESTLKDAGILDVKTL